MEQVFLEKRDIYAYPSAEDYFSPAIAYPEYPFSVETLSNRKNDAYDMVRATLYGLGLDRDRFGTAQWNPLRRFLDVNGTVVVKPNWVNNKNPSGSMDSLVTHPSIIRCIIDYCVIAGAGKIILGDAPIQGADLDDLLSKNEYWHLINFYKKHGIEVLIIDFRSTIVKVENYVIKQYNGPRIGENDVVDIDLSELSYHSQRNQKSIYRICGYTKNNINKYHINELSKHTYSLSKTVLGADLIINVPKPKTHRFAGITGAQKNFVGICPDKESLPHYRSGNPKGGGDETNRDGLHSFMQSWFYEKYLLFCSKKLTLPAIGASFADTLLERVKKEEEYSKGAWHGNDTIWRTILDLNLIIKYTNKQASLLLDAPPRNILTIGDMLIVGEKNGPLAPCDKPLGIIMASTNATAFDAVFCQIAGYNYNLIPTILNSCSDKRLLEFGRSNIMLYSNVPNIDGKLIDDCLFPASWGLKPSPFWAELLN